MASADEDRKYLRVFFMFLRIVLPGFAATYYVCSFIWDLPNVKNVLGIIAILTITIDVYLRVAPIKYDGQIVITTYETGKRKFLLELNKDPDDIERMTMVLFKIVEEKASGIVE